MNPQRLAILALAAALTAGEFAVVPLIAHRGEVLTVAASDDGLLATWDGAARLWSAAAGRLLWCRQVRGFDVASQPQMAVGPEFVVIGQGGAVAVLDRASGRERARLDRPVLAISPDAHWIICPDQRGIAWRRCGDLSREAGRADLAGGIVHAAFSADGKLAIACGSDGRQAVVLRREGEGWMASLEPGPGLSQVRALGMARLSAGGDALVLATSTEAEGGIALSAFRLPLRPGAAALATAALGQPRSGRSMGRMASGGPGRIFTWGLVNGVCAWDFAGTTAGGSLTEFGWATTSAAWLDGLVAIARDGGVGLDDQGVPVATLGGAGLCSRVESMLRSPDGRLLWTAGTAGLLCWDLGLLQLRTSIAGGMGFALRGTGHPRYGVYAGYDNRWRILDLSGRRDLSAVVGDSLALPSVSAAGTCAAVIHDGRISAWLLPGGELAGSADLPEWEHATEGIVVGVSGDGRRVLVARSGFRESGLGIEDHSGPQPVELRVFRFPDLRPERVATITIDGSFGSQSDAELHADGDGWRLVGTDLDIRIGPALTRREAAAGAVAMSQRAPIRLAGAGEGPWYARIPVAVDGDGLAVLGLPGSQIRLISDGDAWAAWTDDGVFDGSRTAARLLSALIDGHPATLDEVAPWCNRPDLLLRRIGCDDTGLLGVAAKSADRRRPVDGGRPVLQVGSRRLAGGRLILAVSAPKARRVDCRYDGAPGPSVDLVDGRVEVSVPIDQGIANVELIAVDADGRCGLRIAEPVPSVQVGQGRLVVACLGVSRYRQEDLRLNFAAKDAIDLALAFGDDSARHAVRHWLDEEVVAPSLEAVRRHLAQAGPADTVVLTLAGHGLYAPNPAPTWYYLPWDADAARPAETGLAWTRIAGLFDGCVARRRLVILDTCESGVLEDGDLAPLPGLAVAGVRGMRSRAMNSLATGGLGQEFRSGDRSRFVTADLALGCGAVVLASSRGGEPSLESSVDCNGLFTAELLIGLRGAADADHDGMIRADELLRWTAREVARRSGNRQHPTIDRDNPLAGLRLPVLPMGE